MDDYESEDVWRKKRETDENKFMCVPEFPSFSDGNFADWLQISARLMRRTRKQFGSRAKREPLEIYSCDVDRVDFGRPGPGARTTSRAVSSLWHASHSRRP